MLFAPDGQKVQGPRLTDLNVGTAAEGADIPMVWGNARLAGQLLWRAPATERKHKKKVGGKGTPTSSSTTYTYSCSFAVGFGVPRGGVGVLRKVILNGKVEVDYTGESSIANSNGLQFTWYDGSQTEPDALIEAYVGAGNVSARPGKMYLVFDELQLSERYGNRLPSVEVEVAVNGDDAPVRHDIDLNDEAHFPMNGDPNLMQFSPALGRLVVSFFGLGAESTFLMDPYSRTATGRLINLSAINLVSSAGSVAKDRMIVRQSTGPQTRDWHFYGLETLSYINKISLAWPDSLYCESLMFLVYQSGYTVYLREKLGTQWPLVDPGDPYQNYASLGFAVVLPLPRQTVNLLESVEELYVLYEEPGATAADTQFHIFWIDKLQLDEGGVPIARTDALPVGYIPATSGALDKNQAVHDIRGVTWMPVDDFATSTPQPHLVGIDWKGRVVEDYDLTDVFGDDPAAAIRWPTASGRQLVFYDEVFDVVSFTYKNRHANFWPSSGKFYVEKDEVSLSGWSYFHQPTNSYWTYSSAITGAAVAVVNMNAATAVDVEVASIIEDLCEDAGLVPAQIDIGIDDVVGGFVHSRQSSARDDIESLLTYALAYAVISDWSVKVRAFGIDPVVTIPFGHLGARENTQDPTATPLVRTEPEETDLPRTLTLQYVSSDNGLQPAASRADWAATASKRVASIQLPLVMSDAKAAQLALTLLQLAHETTTYAFSLPRDYSYLDPGDVILVEDRSGALQRVRLTRMTRGANDIIECEATSDNAKHLETYAVAGGTGVAPDTVVVNVAVNLVILDTPLLRDEDLDHPGAYMGVYNTSMFLGCTIEASSDNEAFSTVSGLSVKLGIGLLETVPADVDFQDWDDTSVVRVRWLTDANLSSTTDANVLAGANALAIGRPGRWELVQPGVVTQVSEGVDDLSHFLRGRRGTNVHMDGHEVGDYVVILDEGTTVREVLQMAQAGDTRYYRTPLNNENVADVLSTVWQVGYEPMQPYTPIDPVSSEDPVTLALTLEVTPRARRMGTLGGANGVTDGVVATNTDTTITGYRFQILDEFGSEVATHDSVTPKFVYSASQITSDYGVSQPMVRWRAAPISAVVPEVSRYSPIAEIQSTAELMYNDLVTGHPGLIEYWPLNEPSGTVAASWSGLHDGTHTSVTTGQPSLTTDGDLSASYQTGAATDFVEWAGLADTRAIEFVIKWDGTQTVAAEHSILGFYTAEGSGIGVVVSSTGDNRLQIRLDGAGGSTTLTVDAVLANHTPYHVVVNFDTAQTDAVDVYIDGTLTGSTTVSHAFTVPTGVLRFNMGAADPLGGWLAKVALYDTQLTPSEIADHAFAAVGNRSDWEPIVQAYNPFVFLRFDEPAGSGTIVDYSGNGNDGANPGSYSLLGVPGVFDTAIDLSVDNDFGETINLGNDLSLRSMHAGSASVGFWLKAKLPPPLTIGNVINQLAGIRVYFVNTGGVISLYYRIDFSTTVMRVHSNPFTLTGDWQFFTCVLDGATKQGTIYVDGVEVTGYQTRTAGVGTPVTSTGDTTLAGLGTEQFLDEFFVVPVALTPTQVAAMYAKKDD